MSGTDVLSSRVGETCACETRRLCGVGDQSHHVIFRKNCMHRSNVKAKKFADRRAERQTDGHTKLQTQLTDIPETKCPSAFDPVTYML